MFTATPEAIIEQAKHLFVSENFNMGFTVLRDCFAESEVSNDTILSLLKGEMGYTVDGENIEIDKSIEVPSEYKEDVNSILECYDFISKINDSLYQITSKIPFDISNYAETNEVVKMINGFGDEAIRYTKFKYFNETTEMMAESGSYDFLNAEYLLFSEGQIFVFSKCNVPIIEGITKTYSPIDATKAFIKAQND